MKDKGIAVFDVMNLVVLTVVLGMCVYAVIVGQKDLVSETSVGLLFVYTNGHIMMARIEVRRKIGKLK